MCENVGAFFRGRMLFAYTTLSVFLEISLKTRAAMLELPSTRKVSTAPCKSSASALARPGREPPSRRPIPLTSSYRNQISKATAKLAPTAARYSPSSAKVRAHGNSGRERKAGSLVAPDHLRFDFSHFTAIENEELQDVEDLINKEVLRNQKIEVIENVPIDVAINEYKAMALFGEKYGDSVRVIRIGDFSTELCGGTHTAATGEIGLIKVLKEGSVSSGVRRIEAVTGEGSLHHFQKDHQLETVVAELTSREANTSPAEALKTELEKKDAEIKRLARELDQARMKSASSTVASVTDKIKDVGGVKVLAHRVDNLERAQMRTLVDQLRDKLGSGVVVLGSASNGNVALIVGVTKDLTSKIQAGKVIGPVAQKVGGKGGGRPDLAEAGGKDPGALDAALREVYGVVEALLGK